MQYKLLIALSLLIVSWASYSEEQPQLQDLDGQAHHFSEYIGQGKWTVVNVWSTACVFCRRELPDLIDFHEAHKNTDAIVLGITIDLHTFGFPQASSVKAFAQDYFVDYPLLLSDAETAAKLIGAPITSIPITFFFNPEGERVGYWSGVIPADKLEEIVRSTETKAGSLGTGSKSKKQPMEG